MFNQLWITACRTLSNPKNLRAILVLTVIVTAALAGGAPTSYGGG